MDFQEFLLETLYGDDDVEILQKKLEEYQGCVVLSEWVKDMSPFFLEVAARMIQHWGKKKPSDIIIS